ncbi:MAG: hypothetical protein CMP61_01520 [Flavobacteriales bacterium]|nr:hypothetical protein [Flavobacteriales bacterium]
MKKLIVILTLLTGMYSCRLKYYNVQTNYVDFMAQSKDLNVCKQLKDSAVVFAVFVDAKNFYPWTEFAVNSTLDSIKRATDWISKEAKMNGIQLKIKTIHHIDGNKISFEERKTRAHFNLNQNFTFSKNHRTRKKEYNRLNHWADHVAKYVGKRTRPNTAKTGSRFKVNSIEHLILTLQDKYKTDNIAVMIFVNGFFQSLPSVTYHSGYNGLRPEYCVLTEKNPATIAHEFLHLFGAIDLYPNPEFPNFNFEEIKAIYPDEIMRITHKNIDKLMLSPMNKYYIGWQDTLDKSNTRLLYHKARVLEY